MLQNNQLIKVMTQHNYV